MLQVSWKIDMYLHLSMKGFACNFNGSFQTMLRSFLPFIMAFIGLSLLLLAGSNPLFEWQISAIVTDFPSSYEVDISHSPWKAHLGDSLSDRSYVFRNLYVSENGKGCSANDFGFVVNRSQRDERLEQFSLTRLFHYESKHLVLVLVLLEIVISVAYGLWSTIWQEHRPVSLGIVAVLFATLFFCFALLPAMRVIGPKIGFYSGNPDCHGTIMFSAKLSKIYFWMPLSVLGILAEFTALGIMAYQVVMVTRRRSDASKSAAG